MNERNERVKERLFSPAFLSRFSLRFVIVKEDAVDSFLLSASPRCICVADVLLLTATEG